MSENTTEGQEPQDSTTTPLEGDTTEGQEHDAPETFDRAYVEELRRESANYRTRAKTADDLRSALWAERVRADGRLHDVSDLPMPDDADPLDTDSVQAAVDALIESKPHLARRKVTGEIGQGQTTPDNHAPSLLGLMNGRN